MLLKFTGMIFVVFALVLLLYLLLSVTCIISWDDLIYFISVITCIPSWDIRECSYKLVSSYEYLSISLHVWRIIIFDSRLVGVHLRLWLGLIWDWPDSYLQTYLRYLSDIYLMIFQTRIHWDNKAGLSKMLP